MNARQTRGREPERNSRGRIAPPTRHARENPEALTMRDIPAVLQQTKETEQTQKPHFSTPVERSAPVATSAAEKPDASEPAVHPDILAQQRSMLGFDDIPIANADELTQEKELRERVATWAKEAYTRSLSPAKRQRLARFFKDKEFLTWADDLKWALKAERGEDPDDPKEKTNQQPQPPANVVADPHQPRRIHVPQRGPAFGASLRGQSQPPVPLMPQAATPAPATTGSRSIDININFGSLPKLPKIPSVATIIASIKRIEWNRRTQVITGVTLVFALFVLPPLLAGKSQTNGTTTDADGTVITSEEIVQKPEYRTLTPEGKEAASINWKRVSPPNSDPVFAYEDKIDDAKILVSQQPLPDDFKSNVDGKIADLAKDYSATSRVVAGTTLVYVGTSVQGPQSVIFTKNDLLVLIKSTTRIDNSDWGKYAQSLN